VGFYVDAEGARDERECVVEVTGVDELQDRPIELGRDRRSCAFAVIYIQYGIKQYSNFRKEVVLELTGPSRSHITSADFVDHVRWEAIMAMEGFGEGEDEGQSYNRRRKGNTLTSQSH
jgi:hypothetical protein